MIVVYLAQKSWSFTGEISLKSPKTSQNTTSHQNHFERVQSIDDDTTIMSDARFSYYFTRTQSLEMNSIDYIPNLGYGEI